MTGLPGFEPGLGTPEAPVLSWLDHRPIWYQPADSDSFSFCGI